VPLIYCPNCGRITYAHYHIDNEGYIVGYRCSRCYNVFNYDQVNVIDFPNDVMIINTTFRKLIAEVDKVDEDSIAEEGSALAERVLACILFLARPDEVRVYRDGLRWLVYYAPWDYRGTREADERNDEIMERVMEVFARAVDDGYYVIELREMDEGDSIFFAIHPDDIDKIREALKHYGFLLGHAWV